MVYLTLEPSDTIQTALNKIRQAEEEEVLVEVPEGSSLFGNLLNLKLLKRKAGKAGKKIKLETTDSAGKTMIKSLLSETQEPVSLEGGGDLDFVRGEDIASLKKESGFRSAINPLVWFGNLFSGKMFFPRNLSLKTFRSFFLLGTLAVFVLGGLITALLYIPKATVHLKVNSEELVKSIELMASPGAEIVDPAIRALPVVPIEVIQEDKREIEATGKRTVGDKAKGAITIYNKTDTDRTFSKGTEISLVTTDETLKFLLDEALYVPKREVATTSAEGVSYSFGKASVEVTAAEIGEKYNLAADKSFSVGSESTDSFVAKNEKAFSGGESRQVSVVTEDDQKKLSSSLETILREKAIEALGNKVVGDQKLEKEAITTEIVEEKFDKEVGEETEELGLAMTLKATAYVYSEAQLNELLGKLLEEFVPEQYALSEKDKTVGIEAVEKINLIDPETEEEKPTLKFTAKVRGFVIPKLDEEKIKRDLAGKSLKMADDYLRTLPNVSSYRYDIFPPLPGPFRRFPRAAEKIKIEIEHE